MEALRQNIIEERKAKNLTQEKIAILLNLPTNTYGSWERGQCEPSAEMLIKLADIFECSVDYLLGRASELDVVSIQTDLTEQQKELLANFDKLNTVGKSRMLGYLVALLGMPAYVRK